jgi:hypothetical protein
MKELVCNRSPAKPQRFFPAGVAAEPQGQRDRLPEVLMHDAGQVRLEWIKRTGHRMGRHRRAAGDRLEHHRAKGIGQ